MIKRFLVASVCISALWLNYTNLANGQDFSVGELANSDTEKAPDVLPVIKKKWSPRMPKGMKAETNTNVYTYRAMVSDEGNFYIRASVRDTFNPRQLLSDYPISATPAKSGGADVRSEVFVPLIYNPANAPAKGANAIPRVLSATPLILDSKMSMRTAALKKGRATNQEICIEVALDDTGAMQQVSLITPQIEGLQDKIVTALRNWKFAPARQNAKPIPAVLKVNMSWVSAGMSTDELRQAQQKSRTFGMLSFKSLDPVSDEIPFVVTAPAVQIDEKYWEAIKAHIRKNYRAKNQLALTAVIRADGTLIGITSDLNPVLEQLIADELRAWSFAPAMQNGIPVNSSLSLVVSPLSIVGPIYEAPAEYPVELMRNRTKTTTYRQYSSYSINRVYDVSNPNYSYINRNYYINNGISRYGWGAFPLNNYAFRHPISHDNSYKKSEHAGLIRGSVSLHVELDTDGNALAVSVDNTTCPLMDFPAARAAMLSKYPRPDAIPGKRIRRYLHVVPMEPAEGLLQSKIFTLKSPSRVDSMQNEYIYSHYIKNYHSLSGRTKQRAMPSWARCLPMCMSTKKAKSHALKSPVRDILHWDMRCARLWKTASLHPL